MVVDERTELHSSVFSVSLQPSDITAAFIMDFFQSPHYRVNRRLLFYLGQWPLQTTRERFFFRSLTLFLVASILLPKLIRFAECMGNFQEMIQCLPVLGLHAVSGVKFFNFSINAKKLRRLTYRIKEDWIARSGTGENDILRKYVERGRFLTILYSVYVFATLWMYLLLPTIPILMDVFAPLNQSRQLIYLYETQYFVDQDKYYYFILIHAYVTMPISVGMIIGFDTMFAVYVHHACGIFASLGSRLEEVGDDGRRSESATRISSSKERDVDYERIVECIKIHKEALEFSQLLESATSVCLLFVMGLCMLMITMTGFMTVTNLDAPGEALRFGAFALGEIIHMFYICWQGQLLMEHSEHIFVNAYNVKWYDVSSRAQKLLIVIAMRSSVPCRLTAGKIYILSLENFTTALKTSMSYFTVLLSMQ